MLGSSKSTQDFQVYMYERAHVCFLNVDAKLSINLCNLVNKANNNNNNNERKSHFFHSLLFYLIFFLRKKKKILLFGDVNMVKEERRRKKILSHKRQFQVSM